MPDQQTEAGRRGNGVSGQAFVDNAAFREYTFKTFNASVLDMETSALAMVAYANGVPYIAFRSLSDLAGGGKGRERDRGLLQARRGQFGERADDVPGGMEVAPMRCQLFCGMPYSTWA